MKDKLLKTVKCPCCKEKGRVRRDYDYPKHLRCCKGCFADFDTSGEIILDPRKIK